VKQLWTAFASKIDALSKRERISVFVALVALAVYCVFAVAIEPTQRRATLLRTQIAQQQAEISAARSRAPKPAPADPDAPNRARTEELQRRIGALDSSLNALQRELVPAERMNGLLQEVLGRDAGLQLIALRTLPAAPLIAKKQGTNRDSDQKAGTSEAEADVYKHGVEITVRGEYANLHAYLARLERSPWRMFWWRARMTADDDSNLTLII
jgi:MSHA biogenesis protein MshJ